VPNQFSRAEIVAFDQALAGFEDALVISKAFRKNNVDPVMAARAGDTFWRPQPYIAQSYTGLDQTSNFARSYAQLSVPASINLSHAVPLTLTAIELRDMLQEERLGQAALQRLASDINVDCSNKAALEGTVFVKRTAAAAGFDDVAAIDTALNRVGVSMNDRKAFYSSADYNSMASNLAQRQTVQGKVLTAYEKAYIGNVAGFDTYKLDYAYRLTAAAGVTVSITNATPLFYTPVSTTVDANGGRHNVDNRYQTITIAVTSGTVKVGDAFTIAGVNEAHHITKADTGSLKTFRVAAIVTGAGGSGTIKISPPIISGSGATDPELQYQNCVGTPINGAVITFLNTVAAPVNPFWQDDCFEIIPGKYEPAGDSGMAIMSATTESGITVTMARQGAINDLSTKYRWDVFFGLVLLQPEMAGVEMFSQT
jgi:hypothetical protein